MKMEQLTEFVSKSFNENRFNVLTGSTNNNPSANHRTTPSAVNEINLLNGSNMVNGSTPTSITTTSSANVSFTLPFFRGPHPHFPSSAALHSVVDRLNGINHISGFHFFNPAFHTPIQATTATLPHSHASSPTLSPGQRESISRDSGAAVSRASIEPEVTSVLDTDDEANTRESQGEFWRHNLI